MIKIIAGTTLKTTWVSSGVTPSGITSAILDSQDAVVDSISATSSGNGFYFGLHTMPSSPGYYVNEWRAFINSKPYINRQLIRNMTLETN